MKTDPKHQLTKDTPHTARCSCGWSYNLGERAWNKKLERYLNKAHQRHVREKPAKNVALGLRKCTEPAEPTCVLPATGTTDLSVASAVGRRTGAMATSNCSTMASKSKSTERVKVTRWYCPSCDTTLASAALFKEHLAKQHDITDPRGSRKQVFDDGHVSTFRWKICGLEFEETITQ